MKKIGLIAAFDKNRLIGINNKLPWKIKDEMSFFKQKTTNNIIVMGSNTYFSLSKPLPNRLNFVLSSRSINNDLIYCFRDIFSCIDFCSNFTKDVFVIGGKKVYQSFLENNLIDYMYISVIKNSYKVDNPEEAVYFPCIDDELWQKERILNHDIFDVYYYKKK